jgi:hypothetical protein
MGENDDEAMDDVALTAGGAGLELNWSWMDYALGL